MLRASTSVEEAADCTSLNVLHEGDRLVDDRREPFWLRHTGGSGDRPHHMGVVEFRIVDLLSADGAATATPAASTTTQSGATMSIVRFRIGGVPFMVGAYRQRAPKGVWFGGRRTPARRGCTEGVAPGEHANGARPGHLQPGEVIFRPISGLETVESGTLGSEDRPAAEACDTVDPRGSRRRGHRGGPERARRRQPARRPRLAGARARGAARAGWRGAQRRAHPSRLRARRLRSAFYPLGVASPVMRALDLAAYGLRWRRSPLALAHPTADGRCAVLSTAIGETAQSLEEYAAGDGDAWRDCYASSSASPTRCSTR